MIRIGKPYIIEEKDRAFLKARVDISSDTALNFSKVKDRLGGMSWRFYENYPPVEWSNDDSGLWFAVCKEYKNGLCAERSDAFVVAMLWYALVTGSDISFEAPISEKLYFGLKYMLFPAFVEKGTAEIQLVGPVTKEPVNHQNAVGTGMSCGIDSLYTLKKYTAPDMLDTYRLTHLVYFETGNIVDLRYDDPNSDILPLDEFYRRTREIAQEKIRNAEETAKEAGLPLIVVTSNIDEDYYRGGSGVTYLLRYCAGVLALSGLFRMYYLSSSGFTSSYINISVYREPSDYELLIEKTLSGNSMEFRLSDYVSRSTKTLELASDDIAKRHLDVCFNYRKCGDCKKCIRTLLTLDALGVVDEFSAAFDLEKYKKERKETIEKYDRIYVDDGNGFEYVYYDDIRKQARKHNPEFATEMDQVLNRPVYRLKKKLRPVRKRLRPIKQKIKSVLKG